MMKDIAVDMERDNQSQMVLWISGVFFFFFVLPFLLRLAGERIYERERNLTQNDPNFGLTFGTSGFKTSFK